MPKARTVGPVNIRVGTTIIINNTRPMVLAPNAAIIGIGLFNDGVFKAVTLLHENSRYCNHVLYPWSAFNIFANSSRLFCFSKTNMVSAILKYVSTESCTCQKIFMSNPCWVSSRSSTVKTDFIGWASQMDWPIVDWAPAHNPECQCQVDAVCEWCRACWLLVQFDRQPNISSAFRAVAMGEYQLQPVVR